MFQKLLSTFVALAFIVQVSAQEKKHIWATATSGGYPYKYVTGDPTATRFYTLKNGLSVILSPSHKEPKIQAFFAIKAGSKTDPTNNTGLAHYLEHLMFKGTDKFGALDFAKEKPYLDKIDALYDQYNKTVDPAKRKAIYQVIDKTSGEAAKYAIANEYDKMMAAIGAEGSNAFTSNEQTVYHEIIPVTAVDQYLAIQSERFRKPIFRIFHTELEAVYEEKNRGLDNDMSKSYEALMAGLFPTNKYGTQTTIGTIEHLKNPSLTEIRKYYYNYYVPNNMGIIMGGDFNPDVMIKKIDKAFGYMKTKPVPAYTPVIEKPITVPAVKNVYGPTPESLMMGFRFPGAGNKDVEYLSLLGQILSNGTAGLIDLDLVKKQRLLSADAGAEIMKDYSFLYLTARPMNGQSLEDARMLLSQEIDKLKKGDFDENLLTSIVNNLKKERLESYAKFSNRARSLMNNFTIGYDWTNDVSSLEFLSKITKPQIVAFANKYLQNNYALVLKHKGIDKSIVKVEKPAITPVEVNRDAQSTFLKQVEAMPAISATPQWLDYQKDISRTPVGPYNMLSVKNADNSLFKLNYRYKMGTWNNKLLSLAAQYINFLGTENMSAEQISKEFYKLAASFSISTNTETTTIAVDGLQENFGKTLTLVENVLRNCKADEEALNGLKARILKSRENAKLDKSYIMRGLVSYATYGEKNPFNYSLSDEELKNVTAQQLVDILHNLVNTEFTILYFGPTAPTSIADEFTSLHKAPASFVSIPAAVSFSPVKQSQTNVLFTDYDMVQAEVYWIHNGPTFNTEQSPVINLFNNYYGEGMGSIIFQTIRESKALAYSTYGFYSEPRKKDRNYLLQAYVGTQSDKFNDAVTGMNDLLNNFAESPKNIDIAKDNIRKTLQTERITDDDILYNYLQAQDLGLDHDARKDIYDQTQALSLQTVKTFFDQNIKNQPVTYCVVASEKKLNENDLAKYGSVKKLSLKEVFGY